MHGTDHNAIHVLHFLTVDGVGGTEMSVRKLVQFSTENHRTRITHDVAVMAAPGAMRAMYHAAGIDPQYFSWDKHFNKLTVIRNIVSHLKHHRPDLVIAYGLRVNILLRIVCLVMKIPLAGGLRGIYSSKKDSRFNDMLDRITFPLSRGYISNSQSAISRYAGLGFPRGKLHLCYNGIRTEIFRPDASKRRAIRDQLGITESTTVILSVSRLAPEKNPEFLIDALAHCKNPSGILLVYAGDGVLRSSLEAKALKAGLAGNVSFLGLRTDIDCLLAGADVFAIASLNEGIPNAVMEAMAVALPTISTKSSGGMTEILDDGVEGFFVPQGDARLFGEIIDRLAADSDLRSSMGAAARKRALAFFSMEAMAENFEKCVEKLLIAQYH